MRTTSWLQVRLDHLEHNLHRWRSLLGSTSTRVQAPRLCAVVKADAYSLGATVIGTKLAELGVDMLCVYDAGQAIELLQANIRCPILVLQAMQELPSDPAWVAAVIRGQVHVSIDSAAQLRMVSRQAAALRATVPVHLHLDTGMSRGGMTEGQFPLVAALAASLPGVRVAGLHTHFATVRENLAFVDEQLKRFDDVLARCGDSIPPQAMMHVASTLAASIDRKYHRDMVRVGLGLYGLSHPALDCPVMLDEKLGLPPAKGVVRWVSRVVHLQRQPAGTPVGYGSTHRLARESLVGLVPVGHGDGYPTTLGNRGSVRVLGPSDSALAPVIGQVSMDQITIDLTDAERALGSIALGQNVELLGLDLTGPMSIGHVAELAGTSCYEMLCRLSPRVPRVYHSPEPAKASTVAAGEAVAESV